MNAKTNHAARTYTIVKWIVRAYFVGALAGSFVHIVTASHKLGLVSVEALATPLMIDGIAVLGMIMRGAAFSRNTRKIGFRTQVLAASISLTANVYAAWGNIGGVIFGVAIVTLYVISDWLADHMESADVDRRRDAQAKRLENKKQAKLSERGQRAAATRKRNQTAAALEELVKG